MNRPLTTAALLAMAGTGAYGSVTEVCRAVIRETASVAPRAANAAYYGRAHGVYKALYPALREIYGEIGKL